MFFVFLLHVSVSMHIVLVFIDESFIPVIFPFLFCVIFCSLYAPVFHLFFKVTDILNIQITLNPSPLVALKWAVECQILLIKNSRRMLVMPPTAPLKQASYRMTQTEIYTDRQILPTESVPYFKKLTTNLDIFGTVNYALSPISQI